jgi:hypothetical protein
MKGLFVPVGSGARSALCQVRPAADISAPSHKTQVHPRLGMHLGMAGTPFWISTDLGAAGLLKTLKQRSWCEIGGQK